MMKIKELGFIFMQNKKLNCLDRCCEIPLYASKQICYHTKSELS